MPNPGLPVIFLNIKSGVDIRGGERGGCIGPRFAEMSWGPLCESSAFSFCFSCWKAYKSL